MHQVKPLHLALGVVGLLGALYALTVPRGLPYDEPSHWQNVVHIAGTGSLPRVGEPGVSYEAVQAPLSYIVDAVVLLPLDMAGMDRSDSILVVRLANIGWLLAMLTLLAELVSRLAPTVPRTSVVLGASLVAGAPVMVAVGASIQNDVPSVALCLAALLVLSDRGRETEIKRATLIGLLLGLAFLAKASAWPVGVIAVGYLLSRGRFRQATVTVLTGLVVAGWWVARNVVLYDSLSGNNAVRAAGFDFPANGFAGVDSLVALGRSAVTYLWLPVEYWRNVISAPLWVEGVVVAAVGLVLVAVVLSRRPARPDAFQTAVLILSILSIVFWALTTTFLQTAAFRVAYPGIAAWAWATTVAVARTRLAAVSLVGAGIALHAFSLAAVAGAAF